MKANEMSWTRSKQWAKRKYVRNFNWKPGVRGRSSGVDIAWRVTLLLWLACWDVNLRSGLNW